MHFPCIKSNSSQMKSVVKGTTFSNKIDRNIPMEMFGFGIQVFKIESKMQLPGSVKSIGRARQKMQAIQNPVRKVDHLPQLPGEKKTLSVLPSLNKQISQKKSKLDGIIKTDLILNRKTVEKEKKIVHKKSIDAKMGPIIQMNPPKILNQKSKIINGRTRTGSKCIEVVPSIQTLPSSNQQCFISKQQWRSSLNVLRSFYTEMQQFQLNELSKAGHRKNQEYFGDETYFVEAYVNNQQDPFYSVQEQYDPYTIVNCQITKNSCFIKNKHYEDYVMP